ncbi:unnamed protein product [Orchesella dallaii]|uniref:Uncharacterized protein n=1 Tax=Orchesella dallaii TaxID=48710 RepID=A0ABP1R2Y5_9HEXA
MTDQGTAGLDEIVRRELVNGYLKYSNLKNTTSNTYNITNSTGNNGKLKLFGGGGGGIGGGGKKRRKGLISGAFNRNGDLLIEKNKNVTATNENGKEGNGAITTTIARNYSSISWNENKTNSSQEQQQDEVVVELPQLPFLARSTRTTTGGGNGGRSISSSSSRNSSSIATTGGKGKSSSSSSSFGLMMMSAPEGSAALFSSRSSAEMVDDGGMRTSSSSGILYNNANDLHGGGSVVGGGDGGDVVGARRILDIHQISSRLHRSFQWEGQSSPHSIAFSSFYIVPLILLLGILIACVWLFCACCYHTMKKIKFSSFCPGRSRSKKNKSNSSNNFGEDAKKEILTPELLEMRRQERLAFLQAECANLEQQLTDEKSATLTSRASDSDLEYLGASESPPLKRNSISLQDIPQSVIRIRREKELRQIKEEIEYLRTIAQQEKDKFEVAKGMLKGSLLTQEFELPGSKPSSPGETKVEPLSQHISHLKAQRKLNEIRSELENLAMQVLHADEIKAKRSSLQDLPRTALNIQREQNLISMNNEIQKIKNYKLQKRNVIETALEKTSNNSKGNPSGKNQGGAAGNSNKPGGNNDKKASGSKSFNSSVNESPSTEDPAAKYSDPEFTHRASIRRQREQELNRVRVELKDLAYKLNLNPMNYISEDRVRLVPSQSMQSTSSAGGAGQSSSAKTFASTSGLNHV